MTTINQSVGGLIFTITLPPPATGVTATVHCPALGFIREFPASSTSNYTLARAYRILAARLRETVWQLEQAEPEL